MSIVQDAFRFLGGPADVLRASTANRRWHELATADAVWREKCWREGMVERASVFEVAVPEALGGGGGGGNGGGGGGGGGGDSTSATTTRTSTTSCHAAAAEEDEATGAVGLAFYAQLFVLKVGTRGAPPFWLLFSSPRCHRLFSCERLDPLAPPVSPPPERDPPPPRRRGTR